MINIVDTTLRDGKQFMRETFKENEEVYIARLLDSLGIFQLEVGIPALGEAEQHAIAAITRLGLKTRVSTWNRLFLGDIHASIACGIHDIHISAPVSSGQIHDKLDRSYFWVMDCLKRAIRYASDCGCRVTVGAEDASRADTAFLLEFAQTAQEMGAERFRYCDTAGVLEPATTLEQLAWLQENLNLELEFHAHNKDAAMVNLNTLAAIQAGVHYVNIPLGGFRYQPNRNILSQLLCNGQINAGTEARTFNRLNHYIGRANRRSLASQSPCASY